MHQINRRYPGREDLGKLFNLMSSALNVAMSFRVAAGGREEKYDATRKFNLRFSPQTRFHDVRRCNGGEQVESPARACKHAHCQGSFVDLSRRGCCVTILRANEVGRTKNSLGVSCESIGPFPGAVSPHLSRGCPGVRESVRQHPNSREVLFSHCHLPNTTSPSGAMELKGSHQWQSRTVSYLLQSE